MKRRDFLKAVTKGSAALMLALVGCKTEPEPEASVEIGIDQAVDGEDQGGYWVPEEFQELLTANFIETLDELILKGDGDGKPVGILSNLNHIPDDQGGYLVPKEDVDQVLWAGRSVFRTKYTVRMPTETKPFGSRVVSNRSFLEFLKGA